MGKSIDLGLLKCPHCKSGLKVDESHKISCVQCSAEFKYYAKKIIFKQFNEDNLTDDLDRLKSRFKNWDALYNFLIQVFSPVFLQLNLKKFIKEYVNNEAVAINLGSGNSNISEKITNLDIFPYKNVNICCDIENIPLAPESVDVVLNIAVLEHVAKPEIVMEEIFRILKKGGVVYTYFPFMQPYHASPFDYSRRTFEGMKTLHEKFEIKELRIGSGPTSGFLWVLQEWVSLLLSFGIKKIHPYVYLLVMIITFPLKYLDLILSKWSAAKNIASAFLLIAKKK